MSLTVLFSEGCIETIINISVDTLVSEVVEEVISESELGSEFTSESFDIIYEGKVIEQNSTIMSSGISPFDEVEMTINKKWGARRKLQIEQRSPTSEEMIEEVRWGRPLRYYFIQAVQHNDINTTDNNGCTALWYACSNSDANAVNELIDCGADVNKSQPRKTYPNYEINNNLSLLSIVCKSTSTAAISIAQVLLGAGAMFLPCASTHDPFHCPLTLASANAVHSFQLVSLLLTCGTFLLNDNRKHCCNAALHSAAQNFTADGEKALQLLQNF